MAEWFVKGVLKTNGTISFNTTNELTRFRLRQIDAKTGSKKYPVKIAELVIVPEAANAGETNVVLRFDDPNAHERAKPEEVLREMTMLHDVCRLLEGAPTGKLMTLVAAMMNVAVTGLYVDVIAEGN